MTEQPRDRYTPPLGAAWQNAWIQARADGSLGYERIRLSSIEAYWPVGDDTTMVLIGARQLPVRLSVLEMDRAMKKALEGPTLYPVDVETELPF